MERGLCSVQGCINIQHPGSARQHSVLDCRVTVLDSGTVAQTLLPRLLRQHGCSIVGQALASLRGLDYSIDTIYWTEPATRALASCVNTVART
jgi:hypothetical protein